jgi:anaerobic selenocysteine-containing dehydrogenase
VSGAPEVYGELPITCLAEEIETPGEGQIRALITVATNPVLSSPNGPRLAAALDTLDFMVSMDIYLNETTRHADVILPGVSPLEDMHYDVAFPQLSWRNHARYSPPVFPPPQGQPEEWQTLLKLAAIAQGSGAQVDANALDDAQFAEDAQRLFGTHAPAVMAATGHLAARNGRWTWPCAPAPMVTSLARSPTA